MKVAIVGFYGKLGKSNYESVSESKDHTVAFGVSRSASETGDDFNGVKVYKNILNSKEKCDGVIDFSNRENLDSCLEYCLK